MVDSECAVVGLTRVNVWSSGSPLTHVGSFPPVFDDLAQLAPALHEQALVCLSNREIVDASRGCTFHCKMANNRLFL